MSLRVWASVLFLLQKRYLLHALCVASFGHLSAAVAALLAHLGRGRGSYGIHRPRSRFSMASVMFAPAKYTTPPAIAAWEFGSESVLCETQFMPHKGQYELEKDTQPLSAKRKM